MKAFTTWQITLDMEKKRVQDQIIFDDTHLNYLTQNESDSMRGDILSRARFNTFLFQSSVSDPFYFFMIVSRLKIGRALIIRNSAKLTNLSVFNYNLLLIFALKHKGLSDKEIFPISDHSEMTIIIKLCTNSVHI